MTKNKKLLLFFSRMAAMPALFLLMLFAGSTTAYAADYELYIGDTQVTDANKGDILGDGKASYDPGTATLYLNGVNIGEGKSHYDDENGYDYSLYSGTDVVKHLVITGNNSFASTDNGMLFKVMGPTDDDNVFAHHSLMITGSGTLTSTVAGDGYEAAAMTVVGETNPYGGKAKGGVFIGNTDGTGPRLVLTGLRRGAYFYDTGRFTMQGGTMIAKATGTPGTGVTLPPLSPIYADHIYFNGGTIAGFGTYGYDATEDMEYGGAFEGSGDVSESQLGMQRVYPEPEEGDTNYSEESGWCVVGMTKGDHVADTNAVLSELGLDSSGGGTDPGTNPDIPGTDPINPDNPGTGEGNSYHTETVPDSGADIDVSGYSENTKYSVDVEWGAMTFEYKAEWNAETYQMGEGSWKVYDTGSNSSIEDTQHAINKVTITNHSNAKVYAKLSYTPETGTTNYSETTGTFAEPTNASDNTNATWTETDTTNHSTGYYELQSSANAEGTDGTAAVGTVYFTPKSISDAVKTSGINQWTKIGKITVEILTKQPQ